MQMQQGGYLRRCAALCLALLLLAMALAGCGGQAAQLHTASTFAMDTIIEQQAYGPRAQQAMRQVNIALAAYEERLSLYSQNGDIARINAAAGQGYVQVSQETAALLRTGTALSAGSRGAFALSIAPLTLAWGVLSGTPRRPPPQEIQQLLSLVDDSQIQIEENSVRLAKPGMAIDLGGIAKGAACAMVGEIYREYGVQSALLWLGGSVYAHGTKPDGSPFRVGFMNPESQDGAYIASFPLQDEVIAISGGYERYFQLDGQRYSHIFNPGTGMPAQTDIVSVGVIHQDGTVADFYSTTLYVWGRQRALEYMRGGGRAILLDNEGVLYVSAGLQNGFTLAQGAGVRLEYV